MLSSILPILAQGCAMSVVSNVLATVITSYRQSASLPGLFGRYPANVVKIPFSMDWRALGEFMIWCIISTPPNILIQQFLENMLPGHTPKGTKGSKELSLNIINTVLKFLIDQSFCSAANTLGFSTFMNSIKGQRTSDAWDQAKQDFWPLIRAGWSLWPWVSLANYTFVKSIEGRAILGNLAGLVWGIFLSLSTATKLD